MYRRSLDCLERSKQDPNFKKFLDVSYKVNITVLFSVIYYLYLLLCLLQLLLSSTSVSIYLIPYTYCCQ